MAEITCWKYTRKTPEKKLTLIEERQIFEIFTSVSTMAAPQGDAKQNKPLACPEKSWIRHWLGDLICTANQMTDFYMKCNTSLKQIKEENTTELKINLKAIASSL